MSRSFFNEGSKSAFNEDYGVSPESFIEGSATYGLIPANFREFTATGGSTGVDGRLFKTSTGTSVGGYGAIQSFRAIPHRVGKGVSGRFSGYFSSSTANSWQGIGFISIGEEMSFGYNGANFGVWHRYGGLSEVRTITVTGAASGSENLTLTLNGTGYTIPLTSGTVEHNAYEIAEWLNSNQSVWGADQLDDTIIINALSDGAKAGSYTFSSSTATGSIAQNTAGVTKTSDFIAESSWNGESLSQTHDPSMGNLYQISYQNMGWGEIKYYIMDQMKGHFINVHTIRIPNTTQTLGIPNPSMRVGMYCVSIGSTTDLSVYANSFDASIDGVSSRTRNPRSYSASQNISTTNETAILTLRNRRTYNGYNNQVEIDPLLVTVSNDTNRSARVRVRATSSTGTEQNFTNIGTNLVADADTTAINYTGGRLLASAGLAASDSIEIDLQKLQIALPPTLMLVITVERSATGGSNTNFEATIGWYEDL